MTHEDCNITHIMQWCPRGFSNEIGYTGIPAHMVDVAQKRMDSLIAMNQDDGGNGTLVKWQDAPAEWRNRVGMSLAGLARDGQTPSEYQGYVMDVLGLSAEDFEEQE